MSYKTLKYLIKLSSIILILSFFFISLFNYLLLFFFITQFELRIQNILVYIVFACVFSICFFTLYFIYVLRRIKRAFEICTFKPNKKNFASKKFYEQLRSKRGAKNRNANSLGEDDIKANIENLNKKADDTIRLICKNLIEKNSFSEFGALRSFAVIVALFETIREIANIYFKKVSNLKILHIFFLTLRRLFFSSLEIRRTTEESKILAKNVLKIYALNLLSSIPGFTKIIEDVIEASCDAYLVAKAGYLAKEEILSCGEKMHDIIEFKVSNQSWELVSGLSQELVTEISKLTLTTIEESTSKFIAEKIEQIKEKIKKIIKKN